MFCTQVSVCSFCFFFSDTATTEIYTLSLHDALPILGQRGDRYLLSPSIGKNTLHDAPRSEEHTSELQSRGHLVCRLLPEKKKTKSRVATCPPKKASTNALTATTP